jgi:hypothetical protein
VEQDALTPGGKEVAVPIDRGRTGEASRFASHLRLMLGLLPVLLLLAAAFAPASASAQSVGDCTAEVSSTQDPAVAAFSFDCGTSTIVSAELTPSESGSIEEGTGTDCSPDGASEIFTCRPTSSPSSLVTGRFRASDESVCDDSRLSVSFAVETNAGRRDVEHSRVSNCSNESDAGASQEADDSDCEDFASREEAQNFFEQEGGPEEDPHFLDADNDGVACEGFRAPTGGVDSGGGGTADPGRPSPLLFVLGGTAIGLLLAGVTTLMRRRRFFV